MRAGRKKHLVHVVRKPDELDEYGQEKPPIIVRKFRANVQIISANTYILSGADLDSEYISMMTRFDRRLAKSDVLVWKNREYRIEMIRPDEREKDMVVTCLSKDSVERISH